MPTPGKDNGEEFRSPTFKQFTSEKKARMKTMYPFLTDDQIMGKLKQHWKTQGITPAKSPKLLPGNTKKQSKPQSKKLELELFGFDGYGFSPKLGNSTTPETKHQNRLPVRSTEKKTSIMKICTSGSKSSGLNVSFHSPAEEFLYSLPDSSQGYQLSGEPVSVETKESCDPSSKTEPQIDNNDVYTMGFSDDDDFDEEDAVLIRRNDFDKDSSQEEIIPEQEVTQTRGRKRLCSDSNVKELKAAYTKTGDKKVKKIKIEENGLKACKKNAGPQKLKTVVNEKAHFDIERDFNFDEDNMEVKMMENTTKHSVQDEHVTTDLKRKGNKECDFDEDDTDFNIVLTNHKQRMTDVTNGFERKISYKQANKHGNTPEAPATKIFDYSSPLFEDMKIELAKIEAGKAPKKRKSNHKVNKAQGKHVTKSLSSIKGLKNQQPDLEHNGNVNNLGDCGSGEPNTRSRKMPKANQPKSCKKNKNKQTGLTKQEDDTQIKKKKLILKNISNSMNPSGDACQVDESAEQAMESKCKNKRDNGLACKIEEKNHHSLTQTAENQPRQRSRQTSEKPNVLTSGGEACSKLTTRMNDEDNLPLLTEPLGQDLDSRNFSSSQSSSSSSRSSGYKFTRGTSNPALRRALRNLRSANISLTSPRVMSPGSSHNSTRSSPRLLSPAMSGISELSSASSWSLPMSDDHTNNICIDFNANCVKLKPSDSQDLCALFTDVTPPEKKTKGAYKTQRMLSSTTPETGLNVKALFQNEDDFLFK